MVNSSSPLAEPTIKEGQGRGGGGGRGWHLECSSWNASGSSFCPWRGLKLLNHFRNLVREVLEPVLLIVLIMSPLMPSVLPIALAVLPIVLPIAAGMLPFAAALGLPIGMGSPADLRPIMEAATDAAGMVAPGLKADMVWPILRAEVCAMPSAHPTDS